MSNVVREPRSVVRKLLARPQHEGVGAVVRRSIGRSVFLPVFVFVMSNHV